MAEVQARTVGAPGAWGSEVSDEEIAGLQGRRHKGGREGPNWAVTLARPNAAKLALGALALLLVVGVRARTSAAAAEPSGGAAPDAAPESAAAPLPRSSPPGVDAVSGSASADSPSSEASMAAPGPISSFCWGEIRVMGKTIRSDSSVKGVLLEGNAGKVSAWDWANNIRHFGDAMRYHRAGIQLREVKPLIDIQEQVIFLTAGVVGVLQVAGEAISELEAAGYELIDLYTGNKEAKAIGRDKFKTDCTPHNIALANLSRQATRVLQEIKQKVATKKKLAIRAYTGDSLILMNLLEEQKKPPSIAGLIHSSC